ncbi:MAG: hypothetical protein P4M12_09400 [Gammaproteobacteria bacterium]|nr:hypothetical protein [Gammaproteobacteria bacterium]
MSLPNVEIVTALFESYLNIRKSVWSLNIDDPLKTPLSYKPASKRDICTECVQAIEKTKANRLWAELAHDFIVKAQAELVKANEARNSYLWMGRFFVDRPLLLETLCAATSYIHAQLKTEPNYNQISDDDIESFKALISNLNYLNSCENTEENYHLYFFDSIILTRESEATQLKESQFSDYEANVLNKSRQPVICNKILDKSATVNHSAATSSTSFINAVTALVPLANPVTVKEADVEVENKKFKPTANTKRVLRTRAQKKALAQTLLYEPSAEGPRSSM